VIDLLALPFLACLVLTGIHAYLGLHVLARGVIFVDLALAQVAALGLSVAVLAGHGIRSDAAYWYALAFTLLGAGLFAVTRFHRAPVPQEAIIGIVYAVAAAVAVLVVDRAPQGSEHIKQLLVGGILTVAPGEVAGLAGLYAAIGLVHFLVRRPLLEISLDPERARRDGRPLAAWDFLFYASFGVVVTSSVRVAGVLLVFSYLIVPAVVGALVASGVGARLLVGWGVGAAVSAAGLLASWVGDLPTGATIVTAFGALLAVVALALGARAWLARARADRRAALADVALALAVVLGTAGVLLVAFPRMDQPWLAPFDTAFLDGDERQAWADTERGLAESLAELERTRRMQDEIQWGAREMSPEMRERLRQYIAGRTELATGDRFVLRELRARARERARLPLGLSLVAAAALLGVWRARLTRLRRARGA